MGSQRHRGDGPDASVVIPARNEAEYLPRTIESVRGLETDLSYETLVVDGDSDDRTPEIAREHGVRVVEQTQGGIGRGRDLGARESDGEWLAFVDADTVLDPEYLDELVGFVRERDLAAASARCRMEGIRAKPMEAVINRVFPRLDRPVLPGFNLVVPRSVYEATGGFPDVPNEDTAFSRRLARHGETAYHPERLVETSSRRFREQGLTGTTYHYVKLDLQRFRADY